MPADGVDHAGEHPDGHADEAERNGVPVTADSKTPGSATDGAPRRRDADRRASGAGSTAGTTTGSTAGSTAGTTRAAATFVERFAADLTDAGMQRMAARVFACLLAEDSGALTSVELAERLQVSPAAVSGAVRYLSQSHLISREREPGSRRERYQVHADAWYQALVSRDATLARWRTTLRLGIEALGEDSPAGRRLVETCEFFEFFEHELDQLLRRWQERRATEGYGEQPPL